MYREEKNTENVERIIKQDRTKTQETIYQKVNQKSFTIKLFRTNFLISIH